MDAFAYVVEILEMGLRYFEAEDGPVLETAEEIEREFSENSSYREEDFEDIGISLESF
jgi:hypothetical protein